MEHLGLSGMPVFAAGDGENDLDLFTLAQKSFAPATAPAQFRPGLLRWWMFLKRAADHHAACGGHITIIDKK
jgi:hypothetical protein